MYHKICISFKSKVNTPTQADISKLGFMIWLTNAKTHKIDNFTFKKKNGYWKDWDIS